MKREPYSTAEIVLCTYIARFGRKDFDEKLISRLEKRSSKSVKMKVQNIAAMLREEGFEYSSEVSPLSGTSDGKGSRYTNWDVVSKLVCEQ